MLKNAQDAEELMIDAFARLVANGRRFEGRASLKTYLYAIGKNLSLRQKKKRERENGAALGGARQAPADSAPIESGLLRGETRRQLYAAMQALKEDHRQALLMVYFDDMSYAEAGAVLRKTEAQISSLVYRAKAALKRALEREGFSYED
jgi:RNA polymerase sigma-70 factor (ECF subfamily)